MSNIMKCENCQHRREDKRYYTCQHENDKYYCTVFSMYVSPNDFCSYYAERKEKVGGPTTSDSISRQAAIYAVRNCNVKEVTPAYMLIDKAEIMTELMMLPPTESVKAYTKADYIMALHKEYGCTLTMAEEAHNKALEHLRSKARMKG